MLVNIIVGIIITMCIFAHMGNGKLVSSLHDYYKSVSLCKRLRRPLVHLRPYFYVRIICISFLQQEAHTLSFPIYMTKPFATTLYISCNTLKIPIVFSKDMSYFSHIATETYHGFHFLLYNLFITVFLRQFVYSLIDISNRYLIISFYSHFIR